MANITRRVFLVGSAAIAGGVAFGFYTYRRPHDNPLENNLAGGAAAITPWVKIDQAGITLITPHVDLGQGAASMQASLIAEELDVRLDQVKIDFGVPAAAYYNTAMAAELAPFMSTDESAMAQKTRSFLEAVSKMTGLQGTGGSSSTADSFEKLRIAGAVARETLKHAAAIKSGVPVNELQTSDAEVRLPDGSTLAYTELAAEAARLAPITDVNLRPPTEWKLIGKKMQRLDIVPKSTGELRYGIDLHMEDMLYATVSTNPRQGGAMNSYDDSEARSLRGVEKIVALDNGVAVLATNTWYAIRAAKRIKFDWGPAPYPPAQEEHWQEVADSFTEKRLDKHWRDDGDVEQALEEKETISSEYRAPYVAHAPLEPLNVVIKRTDDRVDFWTSHQVPRFAQQKVAKITGHAIEDVHFHNQFAGGSFGHRLEFEHIQQAAQIARQVDDIPIKLCYSREEDFAHDFPRQIGMARGRGSVVDGEVVACDLAIATVSASASQMGRLGFPMAGPDSQIPAGAWNLPYAIPNFRVSAYRVPELAPTSSWRSVGASSAGFFAESFIDEIIHATGKDAMQQRLRWCNDPIARRVLQTARKRSNWANKLPENSGRGVAFVNSFGVPCAEVVEVTMTPRGIKIDKVTVVADVGKVVDPVNFDNQVKGAVVWGLGHAMNSEITYADGMAQQSNYHMHVGMRMYQCPQIEVIGLENATKVRGIGEPPVPPAAPALANAIFAATGMRLREMPFNKFIDFV